MQTTYTENDRSMLRYVYDCAYFVVRKPAELQYFNGQNEDQLQNSPPAAKSPRREGPDSPTWQDVHLIKPSESIRAQSLADNKGKGTFSFWPDIFLKMSARIHKTLKWLKMGNVIWSKVMWYEVKWSVPSEQKSKYWVWDESLTIGCYFVFVVCVSAAGHEDHHFVFRLRVCMW